jgi:hypothetical protein
MLVNFSRPRCDPLACDLADRVPKLGMLGGDRVQIGER